MSNENADLATVKTPLIAESGEPEQIVTPVVEAAPSPAAAVDAEAPAVAPSTSEAKQIDEPEPVVVQAVQTLPNEYRFIQQRIPSKDSKLRFILPAILLGFQAVFIILFAFFANYSTKKSAADVNEHEARKYPMFLDLHAIAVLGFGFVMTFLKRYGYGSIGFNLLLVALVVQWAILIRGWMDLNASCATPAEAAHSNSTYGRFEVNLDSLINADFTVIAVLISFGALLGKTTLTQLVVLALIEVVIQVINEYLNVHIIKAHDAGRSVYVHLFGALFGLTVAKVLNLKGVESYKQASVYHSDIFALIGTLFLWVFYPSFNGLLAQNETANNAIINTVAAISASCVVTFGVSNLIGKGKLNALHIQHATIAGGIAIGSVADLNVQIYIALIVGALGGLVATLGYQFIDPFLRRAIKLHDTCGVQSLHALPGFISAILGIIFAACASYSEYDGVLDKIYPGRSNNSEVLTYRGIKSLNRSAGEQSAFQAAALLITVGMALTAGAATGILLRLPIFEQLSKNVEMFDDEVQWVTPDDYALKLTLAPSEAKKDETKV